jgi:hypothetical protein
MTVQAKVHETTAASGYRPAVETSTVYREGIVAGIIGAATIAVWFLILDTIQGRPLYTPSLLGTAFFKPGAGLTSPGPLPSSSYEFEMVVVYTWVHGLVFCAIGGVAAKLIALAERNPNLGFGILLFAVIFEFGFLVVAALIAEVILQELAWHSILLGNLLAAAAMAGYFWHRHPDLRILP